MGLPSVKRHQFEKERGVIWTLISCEKLGWVKLLDEEGNQVMMWTGLTEMEVKYIILNFVTQQEKNKWKQFGGAY